MVAHIACVVDHEGGWKWEKEESERKASGRREL